MPELMRPVRIKLINFRKFENGTMEIGKCTKVASRRHKK
jgi:hypothetical protein